MTIQSTCIGERATDSVLWWSKWGTGGMLPPHAPGGMPAGIEHVIGFHEVLLLRPVGAKANRPKNDVPGRWTATQLVIFTALDANWEQQLEQPRESSIDVASILPALTTDVLVHTWDLAKAIDLLDT